MMKGVIEVGRRSIERLQTGTDGKMREKISARMSDPAKSVSCERPGDRRRPYIQHGQR